MKTSWILILVTVFVFSANLTVAQRGKIVTPATTNVMDPDQNGFVTKTSTGFTDGKGYWVPEFELPMFGIPKLGGDAIGDNIGQPCGITDLIPDQKGFSSYAFRDNNNNVIFRFRVGDNNPSVEAWTILLDVDGKFGASDPNATPDNPGFELDLTLIKRNNAGVLIYDIDGKEKCGQSILNFPLSSNFQISIADEVSCGDLDYFYDFYVPFAQVAAAFNASSGFNINANTGLRYAAVTNVSATCAMDGKIADISGVDYNDYKNCVPCAYTALVNNQCPTAINDLCATCLGFNTNAPPKPAINTPIRSGQTTISGTGQSALFIKVSVYSRTGGTDVAPIWSSVPREEKVVVVTNNMWSVVLNSSLQAYDRIVAKAQFNQAGTGCGSDDTNVSSISVTVVEPNAAPVAQNQTTQVVEDTPQSIVLVATDPDGNPITFTIITQPLHGKLTGSGPNLIYTPNLNYSGPDSFTYTVSDGVFTSNAATVNITVTASNDAPVANNQARTLNEDTTLPITLAGSDVDGDPLTFIIVSQPTNGILLGTGANITYKPNLNYFGGDSFTFKVNDGTTDSNVATVTLTVRPQFDPPVATDQNIVTDEDTPVDFTLTASDPDGDFLDYNILNGPSHGTLSGTAPDLIYTPNPDYYGLDSFEYVVIDPTSQSDFAKVTITINPINDEPIADDQTVTVVQNTATPITLTATDVDGDILT
ncbi:MAG: Ig-like domain-containing protein, partial [Cyclobacteriaceae bacterium]|nr:Ig-like domain-containing protein [Cyclobacteriaceae bacterium]